MFFLGSFDVFFFSGGVKWWFSRVPRKGVSSDGLPKVVSLGGRR